MKRSMSRVTAQGQVSVPAEIRRRLGIGPGTVLEWDVEDARAVVRRTGQFTFEDVHRALFERSPGRRSVEELKQGIGRYMRRRHARR